MIKKTSKTHQKSNPKSNMGVFASLLKTLGKLAYAFKEKPVCKVDEFELEHLLLYHGLVGTSPENQRSFKDVRADIIDAIKNQNSANLAIALKIPPLLWEDKLETIFSEVGDHCINTLLPDDNAGDLSTSDDPLRYDNDWRVRANAAHILAFLKIHKAIPRIIQSLNEAANNNTKPAFCHIALSLGQLQTDEARQALTSYLHDSEPWCRVDVASALALYPINDVANELMGAMLSYHLLSDYMAVVIAKQHSALTLITNNNEPAVEGALETIIGVLLAAERTFSADIVIQTKVPECWPQVRALYFARKTPRRIRAALSLAHWLKKQQQMVDEAEEMLAITTAESVGDSLLNYAGLFAPTDYEDFGQSRHAIQLLGELKVAGAEDRLINLLKWDFAFVDDVIVALGLLGKEKAVPPLLKLAQGIVNVDERQTHSPSQYPVAEENPKAAQTYWHILKSLGQLPEHSAIQFLCQACNDFAPDKREQALQSLIDAYKSQMSKSDGTTFKVTSEIEKTISKALQDPSMPVKMAALYGVETFQLIDCLPAVLKLSDAKEVSLRDMALNTITSLGQTSKKNEVISLIETKVKTEFDSHKRGRLSKLLESLRQ